MVSDHDHRLQIDISQWYCNCLSHQQFPYSSRSQASKVLYSKPHTHYRHAFKFNIFNRFHSIPSLPNIPSLSGNKLDSWENSSLSVSCGVSFNGSTLLEIIADLQASLHSVLKHIRISTYITQPTFIFRYFFQSNTNIYASLLATMIYYSSVDM